MPAKRKATSPKDQSTATIGFEAKLWLAADKLRNNMDAAEPSGASWTTIGSPEGSRGGANQYKHVVLGLIFLKYISDTFRHVLHPDRSLQRHSTAETCADLVLANP